MQLSSSHDKTLMTAIAVTVVIAIIVVAAGIFRTFLSTSVTGVPALNESLVGGKLDVSALSTGEHTLEFRARTQTSTVITDTVTFMKNPVDPYAPYGPYGPSPSPYAPY